MKSVICASVVLAVFLLNIHTASAFGACNEYVDGVLQDLKDDKEYFQDPYIIPEKTLEVHKKLVFINYTGEASIYDGHIFGLASLHRDGDVIIDRKKKTHLKVYLGAGELKMKSSGKVKLMGHGPNLKVEAKISYINMKLDLVPDTKGANPKVQSFTIEDIKGKEVKVTGLGPLNFFLQQYVEIASKVFKNLVKRAIEGRIQTFLDKKLKKYVIPEECLNGEFRRSLNF